MNTLVHAGDEVVIEYIKERFDKHEDKFDKFVADDRAWKELHAKEDHDNFADLNVRMNTAEVKSDTLSNVKKINWDRITSLCLIIIGIGTAVVMALHK